MGPHFSDYEHQKELLEVVIADFPDEEQIRIHEALVFAEDAHGVQTRKGGAPFIIHPVRAALILLEDLACRDADMLIATLLHDVIEDTDVALSTVEERFGALVASYVHALSQDKGNETKREYIERIIAGPCEIRLMKAADKLDNARDAAFLVRGESAHADYLEHIEKLYIPLADSTGESYFANEMRTAFDAVREL